MRVIQNGFGNNFGLVGKNFRRYLTTTALTATSLIALSAPALADNWTDMEYTAGGGTMDTTVANTTTFNQDTSSATMQGDADITSNWTVNINMGSSNDKVVVYDTENDPTQILGALNSNGRVYIFDRNGVIFGAGSQVNVGSIVASSGSLDEQNTGSDVAIKDVAGGGDVNIEQGATISVADAGLAAFVAPNVSNSGVINAKVGNVVLASGNTVTLDLYGDGLVNVAVDGALENALVQNSGQINANGGNVVLAATAAKGAVDSVINMDGIIDVSSASSKGGNVKISGGSKGVVTVDGSINANGATGGGTVTVTGENILASDGSVISADAVTAGDGGSVILLADKGLIFTGTANARGGVLGGKGGFVDTSGKGWVGINGTVDVSAFSGLHGSWLVDPSNLTITDSGFATTNVGGTGTSGSPFKPDGDFISTLKTSSIQTALNSGANVFITTVGTPNQFGQDGTITIASNITTNAGAESTLNLEAAGSIWLQSGKTISATGAKVLNVVMHALGGLPIVGGVIIDGAIKTNGGDVTLTADINNILIGNNGLIETKGGDIKTNADFILPTGAAGVPATGGTVINGVVDAGGGNIDIHQSGMLKAKANSVRTTGTGTIKLSQSNLLGLGGGGTIQNAIDAIQNTGTGTNTVNVGIGTYNESVLADVNNLVLNGAWAGINPLIRLLVPSLLETVIAPNSPGIRITADNVTVDGFTITGATGADGYGIWVDSADNATLKNNKISNTDQAGIYLNGFAKDSIVEDNQVSNARGGGIVANGVWNTEIRRNFIDDIRGNGIYLGDSVGTMNITGNVIGLGGTGTGVKDIWGDGIELYQVNGAKVSKNIITNTWDPTKNNTNDNSSGVYLRNTQNVVVGGNNLTDANIIYGVDWDGVKVSQGSGNVVRHNAISDTTRIGIYGDQTKNFTVDQNLVTNANLDLLGVITILGGNDHTITNNIISSPVGLADAGIWLEGTYSGQNLIEGNIIHDVRGTGIEVKNVTDADIKFNSVSKTSRADNILNGDGIRLRDSNGDLNIVGNIIGDVLGGSFIEGNGIKIQGTNGVKIRSNVITGTKASDPYTGNDASGVYLVGVNDTQVGGPGLLDGNLIYNVDWDGVKVSDGSGNVIRHNIINDTTRIGVYGDRTNNFTVDQNSVTNANLDLLGVITVLGGENHTITNNLVSSPVGIADAGIWLEGAWTGQNLIQGNIVHDVRGTGIEVKNVGDVDILNNVVTKTSRADNILNGDGIRLRDSVGDLNIVGNVVGDLLFGTFIEGDGIKIQGANNVKIKSNIISNTKSSDPVVGDDASGIYIVGVTGTQIGGPDLLDANVITNADWDGVKIAGGTTNTVQGNLISHSTRIGIYGEGAEDVTAINNIVYDSNLPIFGGITLLGGGSHYVNGNIVSNADSSTGWAGVYLAGNTGHNEISDNWIYNFSHEGVHVDTTTGSFEVDNNKIADVETGIYARLVEGLVITDNLIDGRFLKSGKGQTGIYVQDSAGAQIGGGLLSDTNYVEDFKTGIRVVTSTGAAVLGNIVNQFVDNGIHVTDSDEVDVKKNVVGLGDGNGILLESSDYAEINENGVALVGGNGIQVVDSHYADILGNIVALTGGFGIYVDPSDYVEIANNWVHFTGDDGIRLDEGIYGSIYGNHVGFTLGDGIDVRKNNVAIYDNIVHHTLDNGIVVYDTVYTNIAGNTVYRTGKNGIFTNYVSEVDVTGNTVKKAGWDGIHVSFFDDAFIQGNTVSKSGDDGIEAHDGHIVEIDGNTVSKSGWGNWWSEAYDEFHGGHDGISVRNIHGAYVEGEEEEGDYEYAILEEGAVWEPGSVRITNNGVGADEPDDEVEADNEEQSENAKFASFYGDDNGVSRSGDDGIEVVNVEGFAYIAGNSVEHSGVGSFGIPYGQADSYGADGIHVRDVYLTDFYGLNPHAREGDIGNGEYNIVVSDNDVNNSLDDGIEVLGTTRSRYSERVSLLDCYDDCGDEELPEYGDHTEGTYGEYEGEYEAYGNTQRVLVSQNTVSNSGWGAPSEGYGQSDYWYSGGDGIHVENVYAYGYAVGASEENVFSGYAVDILGNTVDKSGDDGIDVEYASSTLIDDNTVTNSGWVGEGESGEVFAKIEGVETGADYFGADGIFVNNVGGSNYAPTIFALEEGPGDGYQEYSVVIRRNDVDNSLDDGIQVNNDMYYGNDSKSEVGVYDYFGYTAPVLVGGNYEGDGNNVTDSGFHGLYISGPGHNNVIVSGNAFANFHTGGTFESGLIDLSQAGNSWSNGKIGLRFSPYLLGYSWPENEGEESVPYFAYLDLVDDDAPGSTPYPETPTNFGGTIGKQIFTGFKEEGDFYVYLDDYALTNDGTPIWLNGLNSTYDDITPSDTGGALSQDDLDYLEARFRHFPDAGAETADIFWFGFLAEDLFDINENLIFNEFAAFNGDVTGLNVRILGLPSTGNAGPGPAAFNNIQTFAGGSNPSDLNEIETAAGGDEGGNNPSNLNEIETESGGENENCWSAAANAAGAGQTVNVVYGGSFEDNMNQAASCGTSF